MLCSLVRISVIYPLSNHIYKISGEVVFYNNLFPHLNQEVDLCMIVSICSYKIGCLKKCLMFLFKNH